ncbi:hypothetical protein [Streptomyces sp. ST2-7A]|uniref:hypothetical protein n=1 Tax=Streptomyces sp. ST2-7A TaxID=2907214 RepID=UPI001F1C10DB|nr:hypothetical protein [Streptomyces sp. ST2-7A]MCE7082889.1 hypothetical protein [Streptomyces sp. ST2-7A]
MSNRNPELRKDLDAAVQTRKELGENYEAALIESFLEKLDERIDETVDRAVDKRLRRRLAEQQVVGGGPASMGDRNWRGPAPAFALAAMSLLFAIPLSAIAASHVGFLGLLVAWGGIVGVNACYASIANTQRGRTERRARDDQRW